MPLRNALPIKFKPRGYSDTWDGSNAVPGAMGALQNLIPDPSTINSFICRPAFRDISDFVGFSSPGFVSIAYQINGYVFGLIASGLNSGKDEPFCFNIGTSSFVTVSGITSGNVPTSPSTTGDWVNPTITVMGPYIIVCHPGFNGSNGYFGWFDVSTPTAPVWHSGNTTTTALSSVPRAAVMFSNRIYFAVGNTLQYTDTLSLTRTNPSQSLTAGDTSVVTALSLFTLTTTNQGILQGLLVFKANTVFQITGDAALSTLAINSLNTAAGTISPDSVVPTPAGVFFVAPDGIRIVQPDGTVSEPDVDFRVPLLNVLYPSRMSAAYNSDIYRICIQNGSKANAPWEEYWYDIGREIWTGPHTCQQDIATPYGAGFVCFSHLNPGKMFLSYVTQVSGSSFVELDQTGALNTLAWNFQTSPLGEDDYMYLNTLLETTINLAFQTGEPPITCSVSDQSNGVLTQATIVPPGVGSIWGAFTWGSGIWGGLQYGLTSFLIPWPKPVTFGKAVISIVGVSSLGFKISNLRFVLEPALYYNVP